MEAMDETVPRVPQVNDEIGKDSKALDPLSAEQITLRLKNVIKFARFSYELEEKREQSLISQAGQMLTAFSVASAALLMVIPILLDHTSIPKQRILITAGLVLALMLASVVLSVFSQWRFKYKTMMNGDEFLKEIEKSKDV